ncbi:MAG: hypothetical protein JRI80_16720 [Deltaproteobacteria bacterium]|nr:hypothetical protein [Deltaproteobacteria bacterium]
MQNTLAWILSVIMVVWSMVFMSGCAQQSSEMVILNTLSPEKIARYNDSFDSFREDLWERSHYTYNRAQEQNFELADMFIEEGRLEIRTKTGVFSKGSVHSRYALRGDFDVQIDCHFDFLKAQAGMDQRAIFVVLEKGEEVGKADAAIFQIQKRGFEDNGFLLLGCVNWSRFTLETSRRVSGFHGTLRFVRKENKIVSLYRQEGATEWVKAGSCRINAGNMIVGFGLQNFDTERTTIKAEAPISATFDNFRINFAQEIVEEEI